MKSLLKVISGIILMGLLPHMAQALDGVGAGLTYTGEGITLWGSEAGDEKVHILDNIDLQLEFDFESMGLWSGGTAFVYFLSNSGADVSGYLGDVQVTSNIEANTSKRLYEFWFNQTLLDGKLDLLVGFHDLNSEFYTNDCSGLFNNSSFGIGAEIAGNVPVSIFNIAALGLRVSYQLQDNLNLIAAVYDGDPGDPDEDKGLNYDWDTDQGIMNIVELQIAQPNSAGIIRLGSWYHSAEFEVIDDGNLETSSSNYGMYLSVDQPLTDRIVGFFQGGFAGSEYSSIPLYAGYGINMFPFKASRPQDIIGLGIAAAEVNGTDAWEITYEGIWSIQITDWFTLKSDIQYITHPSGLKTNANVLQVGLRTELSI